MISIDVAPMGYRRMTKASIYKHKDYHEYTKLIKDKADEEGFVPGETLGLTFYIPMPKSFSKKKRRELMLSPHRQRPDLDNLVKAVLDALFYKKEGGDSRVYMLHAAKIWDEKGLIVIRNL